MRPLAGQDHAGCVHWYTFDIAADEHAGLECHAAAICTRHGEVALMCLDPRVHQSAPGEPPLTLAELAERDAATATELDDGRAAEAALEAALEEIQQARRAFLSKLITGEAGVEITDFDIIEALSWSVIGGNQYTPGT